MSKLQSPSPNDRTDRQLLAEFLLPATSGLEVQALEDVATTMRHFGLDRRQMDQIMSAIDQTLQDREGNRPLFPLRISISGLNLDEVFQADILAPQQDQGFAGSGFGFFLVKRLVGQINDPAPTSYKLLEVLIYRETGRSEVS